VSQQGQIVGTVRCAICGTVEQRWIGPADPVQLRIGDEMNIEDELTIRPSESLDDGSFLEPFKCCGRSWVLVTISGGRLKALTGVLLSDGLERANYCSASVDEEFVESTGESLWTGTALRSDWLDFLKRSLVRRAAPLATSFPRYFELGGRWHFPQGPDGAFTEILASPRAQDLGSRGGSLELDLPLIASSVEDEDALPDEVLPFRQDTDDDDTWVVGKTRQRQHSWPVYRFLAGAWLRSLTRQYNVAHGASISVASGDDYPCGATLDGGRWTLVAPLRGTAARGVFLAMTRDRSYGIATLTSPQRDPLPAVRERLARRAEAVVELLWIGTVEGVQEPLVAMLEQLPPGQALSDAWLPFRADDVATLGAAVARALVPGHRMLEAVGGLRPETIFYNADEKPTLTGIAPRGEAFMAGQAPRSVGSVTPYQYLYDAPEVLRGAGPTPASDVFSLCAVLAHIACAEHPFIGEGAFAQMSSITAGKRRAFRGPSSIAKIVDRGMVGEPSKRPAASELAELFSKVTFP
jgi:hypothetical protein